MIVAMIVAMDRAGRLVIPKSIREQAALQPGMQLDIRVRDGCIEIEPAPLAVKLVRRGGFLVAVPLRPVPVLKAQTVEQTRERLRRERERGE